MQSSTGNKGAWCAIWFGAVAEWKELTPSDSGCVLALTLLGLGLSPDFHLSNHDELNTVNTSEFVRTASCHS